MQQNLADITETGKANNPKAGELIQTLIGEVTKCVKCGHNPKTTYKSRA
jgi:hypothetical protein